MKSVAFRIAFLAFLIIGAATVAHAHEIYVLNPAEADFALQMPRPDIVVTIGTHLTQFIFWGALTLLALGCVFALSMTQRIKRPLAPLLNRLKRIAPALAQVVLGISLLASAMHGAVFGVELPLGAIFAGHAHAMQIALFISGAMLVVGLLPRLAAIAASAIFVALCVRYGVYMINYATYAGEAITVAFFGAGYTIPGADISAIVSRVIHPLSHDAKFFIMRLCFGLSLVYASLYAKFFHMGLALSTVAKYHLTSYFHFDPVFLVLGAMIVEVALGLCFIVGFEIRFASLFFLVFLTLSLIFFGEAVWPHLILIGTALVMFSHGYDRYALMPHLRRREDSGQLEPVL